MSRNNPSTTFLVLTQEDVQHLPAWHDAISQRFDNCRVQTVLVGGAGYDVPRKVTGFANGDAAVSELRARRLPQDRFFVVVPSQDHELLRSFTTAGIFPTYIESRVHKPAQWLAERKAG